MRRQRNDWTLIIAIINLTLTLAVSAVGIWTLKMQEERLSKMEQWAAQAQEQIKVMSARLDAPYAGAKPPNTMPIGNGQWVGCRIPAQGCTVTAYRCWTNPHDSSLNMQVVIQNFGSETTAPQVTAKLYDQQGRHLRDVNVVSYLLKEFRPNDKRTMEETGLFVARQPSWLSFE